MAATTVQLERKLGLLSAVAMIVGTMIGSGIFISPKGVLEASKSVGLTMIVWLGCGVIAMLSSLSYVELGTFTAKSGGEFTYILKGLPAVLAFLCSWCTALIIRPSAFAVSSLVFAEYVASPIFDSCGPPVVFVKCLAALAIIVITAINCYSVELTAGILVVFTVAKITALLIIIIGGFVMLGKGEFYDLPEGFTGSETSGSAIALAFYDGLWAYNGWNNLSNVIEELKNPNSYGLIEFLGLLPSYYQFPWPYQSLGQQTELVLHPRGYNGFDHDNTRRNIFTN
ncbi:(0,+)-type amino acid transporter 1-like [Octopus vulgaris]|uniref:(0,+)-type amino acid transporter 1-like n=1 Tax=Octopus vulgaris TaxID=6645 RepID=A0AA36BK97_OCTVU|nr:(0,+)-type amino acid transporter 1-like [Octopus vulgaris]